MTIEDEIVEYEALLRNGRLRQKELREVEILLGEQQKMKSQLAAPLRAA